MATRRQALLVDWLRHACVLEESAIKALAARVQHLDQPKAMSERLHSHLRTLRQRKTALELGLARLGVRPSRPAPSAQPPALPDGTEALDSALRGYVLEMVEAAVYRVILVMAENSNHRPIAQACHQIVRHQEEMARWMTEQIPMLVAASLPGDTHTRH